MCGIFAYTGKRQAAAILLAGLRDLEYRGYDSAGLYVVDGGVVKDVGAPSSFSAGRIEKISGTTGIAHTRWATHGAPTVTNAHPHTDQAGQVWIVHNGIVENYADLKNELRQQGVIFTSDTDSEVIAHLIGQLLNQGLDLEAAVRATLPRLRGTYGLAVAEAGKPDFLITARLGSPLVLGVGQGEMFIASDVVPISPHTDRVVYLHDGELAIVIPESYQVSTFDAAPVVAKEVTVKSDLTSATLGLFDHYMLKEIMEIPEVVQNTLRGRVQPVTGNVKLGGLENITTELKQLKRIIIVGCGTAYYAGLVGKYLLEELAGIPVEVDMGSEFRYRHPLVGPDTALLAISQSGETADTLEAIREGKRRGALTLGLVNAVNSSIARETVAGVYNHAGPEIGVASTKAFVSQVTILVLLAIYLGRQRSLSKARAKTILEELILIPALIKNILTQHGEIEAIARQFGSYRDFLYLGRRFQYPIALEGALKLKEISYIHAEGFSAGEMKHGPLAMIDPNFPSVVVALKDSLYDKMISTIEEIKARQGPVIAIGTEGDERLAGLADAVISLPAVSEELAPLLSIIPLQLFAYYAAAAKGLNVDRPRNLAKSVTVE